MFQDVDALSVLPAERMPIAIVNFLFISALATVVWGLWRRRTTQKPVERILSFTERVALGDFSARIPQRRGPLRNEFDVIAEDLNKMAAELGSVEALRSDFVFSVSHEMKTPLAVMSNYATIMQDPTLAEGVSVEGDADLLALAWNNLLGNALKFTDAGGRVRVTLAVEGGRARVAVADDGCGIDPVAVARIFDKFYQADPSRATRGNGLGLALVKRVVDLHGGEISVESEPGMGSTFTVTLPVAARG